jgi:SAM-dependent methyltransferase
VTSHSCPLCGGTRIAPLESISGDQLNVFWQRQFGLRPLRANVLDYLRCDDCALRYFNPLEAGGPDLYEALQEHDWYYLAHKPEYDLAMPYLESCASVLEVGAGHGAFADMLGERRYVGLDFNTQAVQRGRASGLDLRSEQLEDHVDAGIRYEAVVAFQVLEHVADPRRFLQNCVRALRSGGRLIIAVPSLDGFVGSAVNNLLNMPPHHVTHWCTETFEWVAGHLGMQIVDIAHEPIAAFHREWAGLVLREARMRRAVGLPNLVFDPRLSARVIGLVARATGRITGSAGNRPGLGHTVLAVYSR